MLQEKQNLEYIYIHYVGLGHEIKDKGSEEQILEENIKIDPWRQKGT